MLWIKLNGMKRDLKCGTKKCLVLWRLELSKNWIVLERLIKRRCKLFILKKLLLGNFKSLGWKSSLEWKGLIGCKDLEKRI